METEGAKVCQLVFLDFVVFLKDYNQYKNGGQIL